MAELSVPDEWPGLVQEAREKMERHRLGQVLAALPLASFRPIRPFDRSLHNQSR